MHEVYQLLSAGGGVACTVNSSPPPASMSVLSILDSLFEFLLASEKTFSEDFLVFIKA